MATVRMSDSLISCIQNAASRAAEATTPESKFDTGEWAEKFYTMYSALPAVQRYKECMDKGGHIADMAWEEADTISQVEVRGSNRSQYYMTAKLHQPKKFPSMCVSYSGARVSFKDASELTPELLEHIGLIDEAREHKNKRTEEVREFAWGIASACRQFNTLNQALKHIPMLEKLVPSDYMDKVKRKPPARVKQAPKEKPALDYDAQDAVSRIARATLMGKI